ncbi:cytochrome c oxidase subunit II [Phyllobacterium sp. K27]
MRLAVWMLLSSGGTLMLGGCAGVQSALDPAGAEAHRIASLSWLLIVGCSVVLLVVCALTALALFGSARWRQRLSGESLVIAGGVIFPLVVLTALLALGFYLMTSGKSSILSLTGRLRVEVVGEQWWWRVTYIDAEGRRTESANEIRLPVGQPVEIHLTSSDVIHSFWVPRLAGKLDMIPGRTNVQTLEVTAPGFSRGQCAEYCGGAHALMSFYVVGMTEPEFSSWLAKEAAESHAPTTRAAVEGHELFLASGCGGCHSVRGTSADGTIGPDLTHVGSRHSLAAATLKNDVEDFARWIQDSHHIKPENLMPSYDGFFSQEETNRLASYLEQLR